MNVIERGDFTALAKDYAQYRPAYAEAVLDAIVGLLGRPIDAIDFADVGAGTGIWTRMVAERGCRATAVEPNAAMREQGAAQHEDLAIDWRAGSAEETGLAEASADLLTMASSFHWAEFERSVSEFARVLRQGGWFGALWNTRVTEGTPVLADIDAKLRELVPEFKPVSSGRSEFCAGLSDRLAGCDAFDHVLFLEGRHVERMTPERYLGVWRSVNDVRVQAGPERFERFLAYIEEKLGKLDHIDAQYATKCWLARRADTPR